MIQVPVFRKGECLTPGSILDIKLPQSGIPMSGPTSGNSSGKTFFASSKGKKYYTDKLFCRKNYKQENRIYFATGEEAKQPAIRFLARVIDIYRVAQYMFAVSNTAKIYIPFCIVFIAVELELGDY